LGTLLLSTLNDKTSLLNFNKMVRLGIIMPYSADIVIPANSILVFARDKWDFYACSRKTENLLSQPGMKGFLFMGKQHLKKLSGLNYKIAKK
jgi:hypothetical protein